MKNRILIYLLLSLYPLGGYANNIDRSRNNTYSKNRGYSNSFWNFTSLDGEVKLKGLYRQKYSTIQDFSEFQESAYFSGGLRLNTNSYILHPDLLQINIGGEFFPESNQDNYLVTPDRAEVRTLKGLNIATKFFNNKPVTLDSWASWNDSYSNRENLTNIRSNTINWGSSLRLTNKILPVNIRYNNTSWDQTETETGRNYQTEQGNFDITTKKSFSIYDQNEFSYSHNTYFRRNANLSEIENTSDNINLGNNFYFDQNKNYTLRSSIRNYNRWGTQNYSWFSATENLTLKLPQNLRFNGTYNFYKQQQESQKLNQNKFSASLDHRLFTSLHSGIYYEYSGARQTYYDETRNRLGFNLNYVKKIPTGRLNLSYHYSLLRTENKSDQTEIQIFDEQHILADGDITTLERPHADENTILVKDHTGTIIYQDDFDYLIIEQGDYIELQRIPGGQIPNGATVYVDYVTINSGSYKYDAHTNNLYANVILFNNLLSLYYRGQFTNYKNVEKSDLLVLNYIKRNTYGGKIGYWDAEFGVEYEYQNSTITPFKLMRYYLNFQKSLNKFILSVNGNIRNYNMIDEQINRKYSDLSGKAAYNIRPGTKVDLMLGYRHQAGPGIDLDLFTASAEFNTAYRQIHLKAGVSVYLRNYLGDLNNYYSFYLEIVRRF